MISIYAPSRQEDLQKQNFYKKLVQYLENLIGQNVIILGDFNFVENNLDRLRPLRTYDIYLQFFVCFVWFDSLRPLNSLSVMRDESSWVEPVLS